MKKRIISMVLIIAMFVSLGAPAFAVSENYYEETPRIIKVNTIEEWVEAFLNYRGTEEFIVIQVGENVSPREIEEALQEILGGEVRGRSLSVGFGTLSYWVWVNTGNIALAVEIIDGVMTVWSVFGASIVSHVRTQWNAGARGTRTWRPGDDLRGP